MATSLPDEEEYQSAETPSSTQVNHHTTISHRQNARKAPNCGLPGQANYADVGQRVEARWNSLKHSYNETYAELFRDFSKADTEAAPSLRDTQYGSVVWAAVEKAAFFAALAKYGRGNVDHIAKYIGTKSVVEVQAYLVLLQQGQLDRQLFEKQARNISKAQIPAAVEINIEYEQILEQFADALAAHQDHFDHAIGRQRQTSSLPWLITTELAIDIDQTSDQTLEADADERGPGHNDTFVSHGEVFHHLFKLSNFLDLSERLFMHGSEENPHEHWMSYSEEFETPSMTSEVVNEFSELLKNYLRRILQTTVFLAESRIRLTTDRHHQAAREVRRDDVLAMRSVLNIEHDLWDYWTGLPRRAGFKVVAGYHQKGYSVKEALSYDAVEAGLAIRHFEGRRRSLSVASNSSQSSVVSSDRARSSASVDGGEEPAVDQSAAVPDEAWLQTPQHEIPDYGSSAGEPDGAGESDSEDDPDWIIDEEDRSSSKDEAIVNELQPQPAGSSIIGDKATARKMAPRKRLRMEEEASEDHMDDLDKNAQLREEDRLAELFGLEKHPKIKRIAEIGARRRVRRKTREDCEVWRPEYLAAWEAYDLKRPKDGLATTIAERDIPKRSTEE